MSEPNHVPDFRNPVPPARLDDDDDDGARGGGEARCAAAVIGALIQKKFLEARKLFLWAR